MGNDEIKTPTIAIIGAGFSGICLAANLYQLSSFPLRIIIIGNPTTFGIGLAYSTLNPAHLLNVRAKNMSAFSQRADHFVEWVNLQADKFNFNLVSKDLKEEFIPRYFYGLYLQDILHSMAAPSSAGAHVELIEDQATTLAESSNDLIINTHNGDRFRADIAVLAHGHILPRIHFNCDSSILLLENPWNFERYQLIPENSPVLLLGTGLTMIDAALQLKSQGHTGKIYALSRRGLIPQIQVEDTAEYKLDENLSSMKLRKLISLIRNEIKKLQDYPASQQAIFKTIRLNLNSIWVSLSLREQKQFLRHCLPYWETQRHRIPPKIFECINQLRHQGSLEIVKGRILEIKNGNAIIQPRNQINSTNIEIKTLINCTGPGKYHSDLTNPIIESLLTQGLAVVHELQLGLKTNPDGALINTANKPSNKLYTLGPPRKGTLFECTAVKEISQQSFDLAKLLLTQLAT